MDVGRAYYNGGAFAFSGGIAVSATPTWNVERGGDFVRSPKPYIA
jgi:hypothetical protein